MLPADPHSTPIEYYFTNPAGPYFPPFENMWRGAPIYSIGDRLFSQQFSQLLNTFCTSSVVPFAVTGNFSTEGPVNGTLPSQLSTYSYRNTSGTMTPDFLQLNYHRGWLITLIVTSLVMLCASIRVAVLGLLRRGSDILDRTTSLLKDSPCVCIGAATSGERRRLKKVMICLGDARDREKRGSFVVGTTDFVRPMI
jgi:hypothetical protein